MNSKELEINRVIAEIENHYPPNKLISCYKDFLKHRDYLHFYQYNEAVLIALIDLTYNFWNTNKRINRSSLISVTKRYFKKAETKANLPPLTNKKIFELFKEIVYYENLQISKENLEIIKKAINSIMIGIELKDPEIKWLCDHSDHSKLILNRLLRYHLKSKTISNWAQKNFEKDFARSRRSEITSWIIDENPEFMIDKETLVYDFEYQITVDKKLVEAFKNEMDAYRAIEKDLRPILTIKDESFFDSDGYEYIPKIQEKPIYTFPRRDYSYYLKGNSGYGLNIPDFESSSRHFYNKIDYYYNCIMAWSIAYSRLNIDKKIMLLEKYYSFDAYNTFFAIGKKLRNTEYFNWLKQLAS